MRRYIVVIIGVVVLGVAVMWRPVVSPRLVRFPTAIDRTSHYQGTFVLYVDQQKGVPLTQPVTLPLQIDRHVEGLPAESGAKTALVKETITAHMGPKTVVERNVYAIDRRTMQNVGSPKAYTIAPASVLDRSGTYYLNFEMGVPANGARYLAWKPETGTSYAVTSAILPSDRIDGTRVVGLSGSLAPTPVDGAELAALEAQGFPTHLGSIPLEYLYSTHGTSAVEPRTGAIVSLSGVVEGVSVRALGRTQPVYELRYSQTPASVSSDVRYARDQANRIRLVDVTIPIALAALGVVVVVLGAWLARRRRTPAPVHELAVAESAPRAA